MSQTSSDVESCVEAIDNPPAQFPAPVARPSVAQVFENSATTGATLAPKMPDRVPETIHLPLATWQQTSRW